MDAVHAVLLLYGALIVLADGYGIWRPKRWVEWVERQFVYHRERIPAGIVLALLGAVAFFLPAAGLLPAAGWRTYLLVVTGAFLVLLGGLVLGLPEVPRQVLLSLGEVNDNVLRGLFIAGAVFGVLLILLAFL